MGIFTFKNVFSDVAISGLTESVLPPLILNMTITGSVVILFVLLARLALKKAPKVFSYALWAVVLFRLLCPVSITTDFSLLGLFDTPAVENTQNTTAVEYIPFDVVHTPDLEVQLPVPPVINDAVNEALPQDHAALGADPLEGDFAIGSMIWLLGMGAMAVYSMMSYILLRRKLVGAVLLRNNIYLADGIGSPFVMGLIRPRIYLPSALSEQEQGYIILHEQHHIRRGDHLIKALAFIALCIHWFNPLVWVAFLLSSKDMEMSCDEAVVKKLGEEIRADYSASLLSLATGRRIIAGTPLAFGEGDTKSRIKNMLKWKKPKTWIMLVALLACVVAIVFCATNPRNDAAEDDSMVVWELDQEYPDDVVDIVNDYVMQQVEYYNSLGSGENAIGGEYTILEAKVVGLTKLLAGTVAENHSIEFYRLEYRLLPSEPSNVVLAGGMQIEEDWITEWGSTGQPYLAILCDSSGGEEVWSKIGVTNTDVIDHEYNTAEMLEQYHDKYVAAAMELYKAYVNNESQNQYGTAFDVSGYLELAADTEFQNMNLDRQTSILVEYEDLLDDYTLIARESKDGTTAYIVGQYNGNPLESPLHGMYSIDMYTGEEEYFRFLYREEEVETVEAVVAANKTEFPPSAGYRIEDSLISWTDNSGVILIQPKENTLLLDVPWNRYFYTPNGREYIVDAVSRGIDICGRTDTFLYIYRFDQRFGNIAERIALTEAEAQAILTEERVTLPEGFGFSATLHMNGETKYFYVDGENKYYDPPREGIPQSVLDLAVEKCGYTFASPSDINGNIQSARLDCDWLDTPLYAKNADLPRLKELLTNAEFALVRGHNYGARLTISLSGGETLTLFKDSDGFDTIIFGSYGGYFLGEKENIEFWEMFGLDPDTKTRIETNPADANPVTVFSHDDLLLEVTGVQSTRRETMLADGIEPHEYSVFTYSPGATITVKNAGMRDGSYYEDGQPHATWGLSYTGESKRTRITDETGVIPITLELEGVYNLEASLFVLKFEPAGSALPEEFQTPPTTATNIPFTAQALGAKSPLNGMFERTYETQLRMMGNIDQSYPFFKNQTLEFDSCAVLLGEEVNLEDLSRYGAAYILFRDGGLRQLPLPVDTSGHAVCPANVQQTDSNTLTYTVGAGSNACTYTINLSDRTASMTVGSATTETQSPAAPPSEELVRAALTNKHTEYALQTYGTGNLSAADFLTFAYTHLAQTWESETTYTFYSDVLHAAYALSDGKYDRVDEASVPTKLTFDYTDGAWKLSERWTPGSSSSVGVVFPAEAVEILDRKGPGYYNPLPDLCDDNAVRYYAEQTGSVPSKTFTPANVEFNGQALGAVQDDMTYEDRLAWVQTGPNYDEFYTSLGQYAEGAGCIAYACTYVGVPHQGAYEFELRFADGTKANLPLPRDGFWSSALPDTMKFEGRKFIYETIFHDELLTDEGQSLIHLKGTYHYEVDLDGRTVSLTVLQ